MYTSGSALSLLLLLTCFIQPTYSTFVGTQNCNSDIIDCKLRLLITDVALDKEKKKLKFFINSQVANFDPNSTDDDTSIIINDVNTTTNKYTTLHVEIGFMDKIIVKENVRFCDMIAVKNTTAFQSSPRFIHDTANNNNFTKIPHTNKNYESFESLSAVLKTPNNPEDDDGLSTKPPLSFQDHVFNHTLATSNTTVDRIFSNSTGHLVQCPLYYNDSIVLYYEVDVNDHFHKLGSYSVLFKVISNEEDSKIIGCSKAYVTPVQPKVISNVVAYGVLVLLMVTLLLNVITIMYSTYQESSNPFLFKASAICNEELLKQVDTTLPGIFTYLQYALFMGGLDLAYPGFFQPILGQIKWCALIGFSPVFKNEHHSYNHSDNVYYTLETGGLPNLTRYISNDLIINNWANFIVTFIVVIVMHIVLSQLFIMSKLLLDKLDLGNSRSKKLFVRGGDFNGFSIFSKKNFYLILGQVLHLFLLVFAMPFLILSSFQFLAASDILGKRRFGTNYAQLREDAYSMVVPYNELCIPSSIFSFATKIGDGSEYSPSKYPPIFDSGHMRHNTERRNYVSSQLSQDRMYLHPNDNATLFHNTHHIGNYTQKVDPSYMRISEPCLVFSGILLALWVILCLYFAFHYLVSIKRYFRIKQSSNISRLYTSLRTILIWGYLYVEYRPERVEYALYEFFTMFFKLMVIGLLQRHGIAQVVCLTLISILDLIVLFTIHPHYVKISWWSLKLMFPVARFLTAVLCIAFIRDLELSVTSKLYVAYAQLLIHTIVGILFCIQLFYWFTRTMISIFQNLKNNQTNNDDVNQLLTVYDSLDDFQQQFDYKPLQPLPTYQIYSAATAITTTPLSIIDQMENPFIFGQRSGSCSMKQNGARNKTNAGKANKDKDEMEQQEEEEYLDANYYYRSRSEQVSKNIVDHELQTHSSNNSDVTSFEQLQYESNMRKLKNDYKVREGDYIYRKYFTDDSIDPEIKELWESRKNNNNKMVIEKVQQQKQQKQKQKRQQVYHGQSTHDSLRISNSIIDKVKHVFHNNTNRRHTRKTGANQNAVELQRFEVDRPKKLIVKTVDQIKQEQQKQKDDLLLNNTTKSLSTLHLI